MSEIKVGDRVWVRERVRSVGDTWFAIDGEQYALDGRGGPFIPDVPGLAALAAVVAEVGAERVREALQNAVVDLRFDAVEALDQGLPNLAKDYTSNADILRRLAAALEVK